jgi:hypothetical protein
MDCCGAARWTALAADVDNPVAGLEELWQNIIVRLVGQSAAFSDVSGDKAVALALLARRNRGSHIANSFYVAQKLLASKAGNWAFP